MDLSAMWGNVTVPGNKTSTTLPSLVPGKQYFVMVRAATRAGYGKPSDPIIIITGGGSSPGSPGSPGGIGGGGVSKVPDPSGKEDKPPQNPKPDQSLGEWKSKKLVKKIVLII